MPNEDQMSPVRRIRAVFADMSEESGLRVYSSIRGFAEFLGCSEGAIRKVEQTGELSVRLADLIQLQTGVCASWLMSSPSPSDSIIGVNGRPWNGENLDLFRLIPALNPMLLVCPSTIPAVVGKLVELLLAHDFVNGRTGGLCAVLQMLQRRGLLVAPASDHGTQHIEWPAKWRASELPPPFNAAFGLFVYGHKKLSEDDLRDLEYLKSVEPEANEHWRIGKLLEDYWHDRKRALRSNVKIRNRRFGDVD